MPGKTKEIGTVKARTRRARNVWDNDYTSKFPDYHVVLVSKSARVSESTTQIQEYVSLGYTFLEDSEHPDLAVYGMSRDEYEDMKAEERELQANNGGVNVSRAQSVSREALHGYGTPVASEE